MVEKKQIETISEVVINKDNGNLNETDLSKQKVNATAIITQNEKEFNELRKCMFLFLFLLCFLAFSFFFAQFFLFKL
jgi:hypothetical protein